MNSEFQNKMYKYEVQPPKGVWNRIALELDDAALENNFPVTLKNMEVMPAAAAWQNIATILDESLLINDYSTKLSKIAIPPPSTTWNKIIDQLDSTPESVVSERKKIIPFFRYAIAASILGLIAWGAFQLFNAKKYETPVAEVTTPKEIPISVPTNSSTNNSIDKVAEEGNIFSAEEARNDAALEASKKTFAKLDVKFATSKIKNASDFFFIPEIDEPGVRGLGNWDTPVPKNDFSDRYFFLMTPEGNIIRISKKLSNIVGCVAGAEQDEECLDQLKKWQKKMASPKSIQSSGNLMEILNLANSLQESL